VRRYFPSPIVLPDTFILVEVVGGERDPKEKRPVGLEGGVGSDFAVDFLFLAFLLFLAPPLGSPSLYFDPLEVDTVIPCLHSAFFVAS